MYLSFGLVLLSCAVCLVAGQTRILSPQNYSRTLDILLENSDPRFRPNHGGPPVEVGVTMYVLAIPSVDYQNMRITTQFYFRQFWKDKRLSFPAKPNLDSLSLNYAGEIWQPDTFFANEQRAVFHSFTLPNVFVRISTTGDVLKSERITMVSTCEMNLNYFPMDWHVCPLEMESYGFKASEITYKWNKGSNSVGFAPESIDPEFKLIGHRVSSKNIALSTGNYSRLVVDIILRRNYQFYVYNLYIPSMIIFMLAWATLWMNPKIMQTRVILSITALVFHLALFIAARIHSPPRPYVNFLEFYMGASMLCVLGVVIHHALVSHTSVEDDQEKGLDTSGEKKKTISFQFFEKYIRFVLLIIYVLFIIVYWISLSRMSDVMVENTVPISF